MTLKEKIICECYTGICFVVGDERNELYKYVQEKCGRPVYTHELPYLNKELFKEDFIKVCKGEFNSDELDKETSYWITHNKDNPFEIFGECARCHFTQSISDKLNYCPNCGVKMEVRKV